MSLFGKKTIASQLNSVSGLNGSSLSEERILEDLSALTRNNVSGLGEEFTEDFYPAGKRVSFERQADRTLNMQELLDNDIVQENLFSSEPGRKVEGRPPCVRIKAGKEF